ncbi:MAG: hypothetical protein IT293_04135 [Deltaproteobacteria bacterium]|nr:hypothetical protein [Deltaproteobacteria bacterium]
MYSRLAHTSFGALVALLCICSFAGSARADAKSAAKCSAAIIKAGSGLLQSEAKILQKCRDAIVKGKACDQVKTQASIDKARAKLSSSITKACGGKDKVCDTADADGSQPTLDEYGWNITNCPGFEGACTNAITDCDDIPACIQCIGEASVTQAMDLYYPPNRPSSVGNKTLNKCQATLGKAALTFFNAKSKALAKCWGTKVKKTANCPADAQAKIDAARAKLDKALAKACVGLDNSTVGLPAGCLAVASCGAPVSSLIDVGNCTECVTEFKVDCPDRASSVSVGAPYPAECLVIPPTPTPTATVTQLPATATPTVSPTPSATPTQSVLCGNGQLDVGEQCDPTSATTACSNVNPADYPCSAVTCTCACPTKVTFAGDATDPKSILDTGWTGISHRAPIISDGDVTVALSCSGNGRPCGVCTISGPIANTESGQIANQRCSNNQAISCTSDATCIARTCLGGSNDGDACSADSNCTGGTCPAAGTCEFYFGSNLPLAAGGVTTCVVNQFNGSVSGTANVESGDAATTALLTSRVYNGIAIDNPCPRCMGDATVNDGTAGGTCDGGPRVGLGCDGNGTIPSRPDFGTTSLDCPPAASAIIATLPIDLTNRTGPVTKTLTAASPSCVNAPGNKCLCDTCNNAAATPCFTNDDCVAVGATVCGGKRCLSGANNGAGCANNTECPGGACARPGEPTKPSACLDDSATATLDCADGDADGEGECSVGPTDPNCSVGSGHAQRGCLSDGDCGGGAGSCVVSQRKCFLTGGGTFQPSAFDGTDTLIAVGQVDTPMNDVSNPTLGAVFCVGPTGASAVNNVAGLPGPARVTIKGTARGLP